MKSRSDTSVSDIKERLKNATPGPWLLDEQFDANDISVWAADKSFLANLAESDGARYSPAFDIQRVADAELIANAPADLAWCVARIGKLEKALVQIRECSWTVKKGVAYEFTGWIVGRIDALFSELKESGE